MNLAKFSLAKPVTTGIISLCLFVIGLYYLNRLPTALYPEVNIPYVKILVQYPGGSPEQIEAKITKPLEAELAGLKGIDKILSLSGSGYLMQWVAFKMSADAKESLEGVREKVAMIKGAFPDGTKEPAIERMDIGAAPIIVYGVETSLPARDAKKLLEDGILRNIRRIDGVNEARVLGLGDKRVELQFDANKMLTQRVTPLEIYNSLKNKMTVIPWGDIKFDDKNITVGRGILNDSPSYWENYPVTLADSREITLKDIGNIQIVDDPDAASVFVYGKDGLAKRGLAVEVSKRSDANTLKTIRTIKKELAKPGLLPQEISLFSLIDQSGYIEANTHEVWTALFLGGLFAVIVIFLFLTDFRSAMISAMALPVSVAGTFTFMYLCDFTINMVSLMALSLSIGLLIDDAVVVRESIYSEMERGKTGQEAAVSGTNKVASAVMATTFAIIAVFIPVALMQGIVGQFFKQFGITIVIAVTLSLWVAFTLDPMLSAKFAATPKPMKGLLWDKWRNFIEGVENAVGSLSKFSYKHSITVILLACALLALSIRLSVSRGIDFMSFEDRGQFIVSYKVPQGTPKERMDEMAETIMSKLRGLEGLKDVYASVGGTYSPRSVELRFVFVNKKERSKSILALQKEAREILASYDGDLLVLDPPFIDGIPNEPPISLKILGENIDELLKTANLVKDKIRAIPGVADARVETALLGDAIDLNIDSTKLGYMGTTSQNLELTGRLALTGLEVGNVGADNLPFYMRMQKSDRNIDTLLNDVFIPSLRGPQILGTFMEAKPSKRPVTIEREKRTRRVAIWATINRTRSLKFILDDVATLCKNEVKPPLFTEMSGDKEMLEDMIDNFTIAILGSLFFIFAILASQFEKIFRPFVIILSLPLALIGAFTTLYMAGQVLALGSIIGLILLIGLSAKNGILLVDAIGIREKSMNAFEAVVESVKERTRPILMTSFAMVFGMLPTAIMQGEGSEFRQPMALAIIGGVTTSTLLSFMVIPAIFGFVSIFKKGKASQKSVLEKNKELVKESSKTGPASDSSNKDSSKEILQLIIISCLLWGGTKAEAQNPIPSKLASMKSFVSLINTPKANSAEYEAVKNLRATADAASAAAKWPLLGGAKIEAGRQWAKPSIVKNFDIAFPAQFHVPPVHEKLILVPGVKNFVTVGWQLPIFNWQIIQGLLVAARLQEQVPVLEKAKYEAATFAYSQTLLQIALMQEIGKIRTTQLAATQKRLDILRNRVSAGTAKKIEENELAINLENNKLMVEQNNAELSKLQALFIEQTGKSLPAEQVGMPVFPPELNKAPASYALSVFDKAIITSEASIRAANASWFPSVVGEVGYQKEMYAVSADNNPPVGTIGVKMQWNILDGGVRARNRSDAIKAENDLKTQRKEVEQKLAESHSTLRARFAGLQSSLNTAKSIRTIALSSQKTAFEGFQSGLATIADVYKAETAVLDSELATVQLEFALQGVAMESIYITGGWSDFLHANM